MRCVLKLIIGVLFLIAAGLPLYLIYKVIFFSSARCFTTISEFISLFPGYIGYFIRKGFYLLSINSGRDFYTGFGTILQYPSIIIKDDVYVGQNCNIGKCRIGSGSKIGSGVHIVNKNTHDFNEHGDILATDIRKLKRVYIGKNTWIGNNSSILSDVGDNCIIGSGSVVVNPIPNNCVAVGNPAKVIRKK